MSKRSQRLRRNLRQSAISALEALSMEELVNMRFELGRAVAAQCTMANDLRMRGEAVKVEIERRRTTTPSGVHITDHAVLRFLERAKGVDVNGARAELGKMALEARSLSGGRMGQRRHEPTGLIFGVDEESVRVTTVFHDAEAAVMEVPDFPPRPVRGARP